MFSEHYLNLDWCVFHYCILTRAELFGFLAADAGSFGFLEISRAKEAAGGSCYWASCWHDLHVGINTEFLTKKTPQIVSD